MFYVIGFQHAPIIEDGELFNKVDMVACVSVDGIPATYETKKDAKAEIADTYSDMRAAGLESTDLDWRAIPVDAVSLDDVLYECGLSL